MKFELFIAKKLRLKNSGGGSRSAVSTLNVAVAGIVLAIVIMVMAVAIVTGFKQTIVSKVENLDSHIKIYNKWYDSRNILHNSIAYSPDLEQIVMQNAAGKVDAANLVGEIPCVLKATDGFSGLRFKGVPDGYDLSYLKSCLTAGEIDISGNGIVVSRQIADKLSLKTGDRLSVYFMNNHNVKVRRCTISGIFNTDFDDYDRYIMVGNLSVLQSVNQWDSKTASYVEVKCRSLDDVEEVKDNIIKNLEMLAIDNQTSLSGSFSVATIFENNPAHFAWLDLLDTNIAVVLGLMAFVACFSIIACLIIVVLNKINTIGVLKALGVSTWSIQKIFVLIVMKIIFYAMLIGNGIALLLLFLQEHFHIAKLDAEAYFMSYVPVEINHWVIVLNIGFLIISFLSLLIPSFIISSIKPSKSIRFE